MVKRMLLACLFVWGCAAPAYATPDTASMAFCRALMGDREGMWIRECGSAEEDCQKALREVADQDAVRACTETYQGLGSYCAVMVCVSPDAKASKDGLMTIQVLPDLMEKERAKRR